MGVGEEAWHPLVVQVEALMALVGVLVEDLGEEVSFSGISLPWAFAYDYDLEHQGSHHNRLQEGQL